MLNFVFYLHWALMVAFGVACLSLMFKPTIIARIYVVALLGQQLILNGCIMTMWENKVKISQGYAPHKNEFIMSHIVSGGVVTAYKILFLVIIVIQLKELITWSKMRRAGLQAQS